MLTVYSRLVFKHILFHLQGITNETEPIKIYSREMSQSECAQLDCENARFGFSVARLGDVDLDGFEGIVVQHCGKEHEVVLH